MRYLVLLASVCALMIPGLALAQDEPPAQEEPTSTTPVPAEEPEAQTQTETAPAPAPPPPEPQVLADETKEAPAPKPKAKPRAIAAASGSVTIADFSFSPGSITIDQGDTVTWVNNGPTPHSATANNGSFNTGILKAGQSASHTFDQAGTFSYFCQPHPFMKATVVVQAAQTGGGSGGTSGAGTTGGATGSSDTGATASQADQGPTLPNTGGDSTPLLVLGGLLLALGFAVHRRTAAE